jgi:hypothetical protein
MLLYNITYAVPVTIHSQWIEWMKHIHIPEIMSSGLFQRNQILRLLEMDESEAITYAVQFYAASEEDYKLYNTNHAPALRLKAQSVWGDQVIGFRTTMSIVQ